MLPWRRLLARPRIAALWLLSLIVVACEYTATELPGKWREEDGVLFCDGYMTRTESELFCESSVPEGWQAFEFRGDTYYAQPLSE